jgi:hypothetical protein
MIGRSELEPVHPAEPGDVQAMLERLSTADRTELSMLSSGRPAERLEAALARSSYSFEYRLMGEPVAMGGLVQNDGGVPLAWMVAATPTLCHHVKSMLISGRAEVAALVERSGGRFQAIVDRRWGRSLTMLRWLGFAPAGQITILERPTLVMEFRV